MATLAGLLHHLVRHAPGLSDVNRQEYHDLIDQAEEASPAAPAPQEPAPSEGQEDPEKDE